MIGPESYNRLQAASKEGVIKLPRNIALTTSSGHTINIGPGLTIPNSKKLKSRFPLLSLRFGDVFTEVSSLAKSNCWQDEVVNKNGEQLDNEELQMLEEVESAFEEEEGDIKRKWAMRTLDVAVPPTITKDDLVAHFSSFGVVESFPQKIMGMQLLYSAQKALRNIVYLWCIILATTSVMICQEGCQSNSS